MLYFKQAAGVMLLALAIPAHPQSQSESPQSQAPPPVVARINVLIVREANGKPVKNAEVVLHQVGKDGKQKQEGLELKTHEDGKAEATGIPFGKVRIQVIAHGFRTFGDDFEITQPTQDITIKLQKPKEQFSIYK